jgi:hypothetical protein
VPDGVDRDLLSVKNNCTDDTDDVISRHSRHLPIRWFAEHANAVILHPDAAYLGGTIDPCSLDMAISGETRSPPG